MLAIEWMMTKLKNFDAETLSYSLEGTAEWALCFAPLAQYLYHSSLFSYNFFKTHCFAPLLANCQAKL